MMPARLFTQACEDGHLANVMRLDSIPNLDTSFCQDLRTVGFKRAIRGGHTDVIEFLASRPGVDPVTVKAYRAHVAGCKCNTFPMDYPEPGSAHYGIQCNNYCGSFKCTGCNWDHHYRHGKLVNDHHPNCGHFEAPRSPSQNLSSYTWAQLEAMKVPPPALRPKQYDFDDDEFFDTGVVKAQCTLNPELYTFDADEFFKGVV